VKRLSQNSEMEFPARHSGYGHSDHQTAGKGTRFQFAAFVLLALLAIAATRVHAQEPGSVIPPPASSTSYSAIKSFGVIHEKDGPAVEILSTKPLIPTIQALSNPERLVIDLPNARLDTRHKRVSVQADQITTLRADQFQESPPVARIVVDLLEPRAYTWAAAGNRLVIHLGQNSSADANRTPFQPPSVSTLTSAPSPVVTVAHPGGPLTVAGNSLAAGSSISAGADTAVLNLARGGEVHVCPGTTVSVTPSQNGRNLMLGLNTGALEAHYTLDASSDSVMTPDFRILLSGPGEFHLAISTDTRGNTCVRSLPRNTASAIVTELMGDRTYQVKATDQLVFRAGQLDRVDMAVPLECGCPPPHQPVLRAENPAPVINPELAGSARAMQTPQNTDVLDKPKPETSQVPASVVESAPAELHVKVEAPMVFRATGPPPPPVEDVGALRADSRMASANAVTPLPPAAKSKQANPETAAAAPRRGFFGKLRGFFSAVFR
jgi:AMIN domain